MNTSQQIQLLAKSIQEDSSDETLKRQKLDLVNKLLETACKYIKIVTQQGFQLQINKGTTDRVILGMLADLDKSRSMIHNKLISLIAAVNRMCISYEIEPIYQGSEDRREKGDFAMELIKDCFENRI